MRGNGGGDRPATDFDAMAKTKRVDTLAKKWVSNSEAQVYLGVSAGFLQNLRETARVPFFKVGKSIFYRVGDLDRLIERNRII